MRRRLDLVILILLVALAASQADLPTRQQPAARLQLGGLSLGMTRDEVQKVLGEPRFTEMINQGEGSALIYTIDGGRLWVGFSSRLDCVEAQGRWQLHQGDCEIPGFQASQKSIEAILGPAVGAGKDFYYRDRDEVLEFFVDPSRNVERMVLRRESCSTPSGLTPE